MHDKRLDDKGDVPPMRMQPTRDVSAQVSQDEYDFVKDLLRVLWRRLWMILLVAILVAGAAVIVDLLRPPTYEASIHILAGQKQEGDAPSSLDSDVQGLQRITQTMAEAVDMRPVAETVIRELDLGVSPEDFLEDLSVEQVADTQFIEVTYRGANPAEAQLVANTVGDVFSEQVSELSPNANAITATVYERAATPGAPASPNPLRDGGLALILGGMLGIGIAFLLERLDDSWHSPEEVEQAFGIPAFGVIPEYKFLRSKKGGY